MPQTLAEKILAAHAGKDSVRPGDFLPELNVDKVLIHDVTGPAAISIVEQLLEGRKMKYPERAVVVSDHYVCTNDKKSLSNHQVMREFVARHGIPHAYLVDAGFDGDPVNLGQSYRGVCHAMFAEENLAVPGELLLGADSHTCTAGAFGMYAEGVGSTEAGVALATGKTVKIFVPETMRIEYFGKMPEYLMAKDLCLHYLGSLGVNGGTGMVLELDGNAVQNLCVDEKMTLCNMATEGGFVTGIIPPSLDILSNYGGTAVYSGDDASFSKEHIGDVLRIEPMVALPHSPGNAKTANLCSDKIDRVYIGSCTGGKFEDLYRAAMLLEDSGKKVTVETFIMPATVRTAEKVRQTIYKNKTFEEIFREYGALDATNGQLGYPGCHACLGGPPDTIGRANSGLAIVSTTNRNFQGRMGDMGALIYLASPLTAAASAIAGRVTDPRAYM